MDRVADVAMHLFDEERRVCELPWMEDRSGQPEQTEGADFAWISRRAALTIPHIACV